MKKEELTALGISEEVSAKVLEINGKDIEHAKSAKDKERKSVEDERDGYKTRAETAEETLKSFEGIDPAKLQDEIKTWKNKAEQAEKDYTAKITRRDQRDWLNAQCDTYGIKSPYARSAILAECMDVEKGLKWKDGAYLGFGDYMKSAKEKDPGLYETEEERKKRETEEAAEEGAPRFTGPADNKHGGGGEPFTVPKIF